MLAPLALALVLGHAVLTQPAMLRVGPGELRPLYPLPGQQTVTVQAFLLDRLPVTNQEFVAFVTRHPQWRRSQTPRLFAGEQYLSHWQSDVSAGPKDAQRPVTHVSWFAARAYCESRGARLPNEQEWELAAQASSTMVDASLDKDFKRQVLAWYAQPAGGELETVGKQRPNAWGIQDLHGLVWEWVSDFNATLLAEDSRGTKDADNARFCGSGALAAQNKENYAAFMRFAMRSSLEANYVTSRLGFRCANDASSKAANR